MNSLAVLLTSILVAFGGLQRVSPAQAGLSARGIELLDSTVNAAIADTVFPGAVVAVVRHDRLAYLKSYGLQAVLPERETMTDSTIFDLASLSKPVSTAVAALQLIQEGKLDPDAPVKTYIEGFAPWVNRRNKADSVDIKVRNLLLHSSGLPAYMSVDEFIEQRGPSHEEAVRFIATEAVRKDKPGTRRRYSCLNYITLQEIIEKLTEERLCDYAQEHIFRVLGMDDTQYFPYGATEELLWRIAPTEMEADSSGYVRGHVHDPLAWKLGDGNSGNAGVFSTASDLATFCAALLCGGTLYVQRDGTLGAAITDEPRSILSRDMVKLLRKVDPVTGRTFGWDSLGKSADDVEGTVFSRKSIICHTGFTGPSIVIDFETGTAVIVLCSRLHPQDRSTVKWEHTLLGDVRAAIADAVASAVK